MEQNNLINLDCVKPPWVDKADFYHMPFNYCDRWCEKCQFTSICRVFKDEKKAKNKLVKQGKNPYAMENVFEQVSNNLKKAMRMVIKEAKKRGIDLNDIKTDVKVVEVEPEDHPLTNLAEKLSAKLNRYIEETYECLDETVPAAIDKQIEIVNFYHTMITAKIFRAVFSQKEEVENKEEAYDSKNSAFIAVNCLLKISEALSALSNYDPLGPLHPTSRHLSKACLDLAKLIDATFETELL